MERNDLLKARIALYRQYLREGAEGDMARAYLWLIRQDEIELIAIANRPEHEHRAGASEAAGTVNRQVENAGGDAG